MSLRLYLQKLAYIDSLICKRATGNQKTLAEKMNLSRSGLNKLLNEMREIGFPIRYSHKNKTYYYESEGRMVKNLFQQSMARETDKKANSVGV